LRVCSGLHGLLLQGVSPEQLGHSLLLIPPTWINMDIAYRVFAPEGSPDPLPIAAPAILQLAAFVRQTPHWKGISENISGSMMTYLYSCSSCCFAAPPLTGPNSSQNRDTALLRSWLLEHPEEQMNLEHRLNHRLFTLVTWGNLVSLIVGLQHKLKGRSCLLGCQVPCAAAAAAASAAAAEPLRTSNSVADGVQSSWLQSQLVCLGYTSAPEVLTYRTSDLEYLLAACMFYTYMLEPLDRLLGRSIKQLEGERASSIDSSSSSTPVGNRGSSVGSHVNSSGTTGNDGTAGAGKVDSSSSSSSAGRASQQAEPSAGSATASAAGSQALGKVAYQVTTGLWVLAAADERIVVKTVNGSFALNSEGHGIVDFDVLPKYPVVGQPHVDWLFAPGEETLANPAAAEALAIKNEMVGCMYTEGAAGPVTPTAQHLGLVLELLLLAWPTDGSNDGIHRTETQQQDLQQGANDKGEGWDEGQDQQLQGSRAEAAQKEGKRLQEQQQQGKQQGREGEADQEEAKPLQEQQQQEKGAQADRADGEPLQEQQQQGEQASPFQDELNWKRAVDWLLLLCALLQQATAAGKQQFLMEQGSLLWQLLYHLLLKDHMLGGEGQVHVIVYEKPWGDTLLQAVVGAVDVLLQFSDEYYTVSKLVMLVLQALMFEPVRWSGATAHALIWQARMMYTNAGGSGRMLLTVLFC
jgi:hypothetical protein